MNPSFKRGVRSISFWCSCVDSGVCVAPRGKKITASLILCFFYLLLPSFEYQAYSSYFLGYMCIGSTYVVKVIDIFIRTCIMNTADEQSIT